MRCGWRWRGRIGLGPLRSSNFVEPTFGDKGALRNPRHRREYVFFELPGNVFWDVPSVNLILERIGVRVIG